MATILAIEDNSTQIVIVQRALEGAGHTVHPLLDASRVTGLLKQHAFDLVITDMDMPEFNGIDVIKAVKAHNPDLPVIVFTAVGLYEMEDEARAAGCDAYLQKPMSIHVFREFVREFLTNRTVSK